MIGRSRWTFNLLFILFGAGCGSESPPLPVDGGVACGASSCGAAEVCVSTTTTGGACQARPAGGCPSGTIATTCAGGGAGCVARSTTLECKARPTTCDPMTCSCALPSLCGAACTCSRASSTDVGCLCNAP